MALCQLIFGDGLLMKEMEQLVDVLVEVAGECGLVISAAKRSCMIFNEKNKPVNIGGIIVADRMKCIPGSN